MAIPMILILLTVVFFVMRIAGDPVTAALGGHAPQSQIEQMKEQLGLNKPVIFQYIDYVIGLFHGDLGTSIQTSRPVWNEIMDHFPATIELAVTGFLTSVLIGAGTGIFSARNEGKKADHAIRVYGMLTYSIFLPLFAIFLQLVFSVWLGVLPVSGRISFGVRPDTVTGLYVLDSVITADFSALVSSVKHLILPAVAIGVYLSGIYTRLFRTNMADVLRKDFVRSLRSRGLSENKIVYGHALKNTLVPVITMMGLQFAILLAGAVLTETVFSWPGIGTFLVRRVGLRDYTAVQGTIVFFAILVVIINTVVDLIYAYIDPRIRY